MQKKKRVIRYLRPLGFGTLLLLIPLLRDLHLESALLVSTLYCFLGGLRASVKSNDNYAKLITGSVFSIFLIAVPLLVHGLIANCLTWSGIGFWVLLPVPSILFGVAIGRFYSSLKFPIPRLLTLLTLILVGLGTLIFELFTLPQVYYFNHVWGTWPGPIYDEEIRITTGLIWFRLSTLVWVLLLWLLPKVSTSRSSQVVVLLSGILIVVSLFLQPQLGISTPRSFLKTELSSVVKTEHFHLYFDESNYTDDERSYWAARHEFHFNQIIEQLEIDWPEGRIIESFLYENAWQKKELVGAKFTSYVPVWLEQDQLHIAKEHLEPVLKHELVHVIAKQFGNDLINASWSIGLVEGVAEAIAKDASNVSTIDQIIAAEYPLPTTSEMALSLTLSGFYSAASSISYTTAGSFVGYLLENYPVENFKSAYPSTDFEGAYNVPFDTLVTRWKAQLPVTDVDSLDTQVSQFIFSQQSLFQMSCPRKIHPVRLGLDDLRHHESLSDSANALNTINNLYEDYSQLPLIKQLWASYQLRTGNSERITNEISDSDSTLALQLMKADSHFLGDDFTLAEDLLSNLKNDSSHFINENAQNSFVVRTDSLVWQTFINARYQNKLVSLDTFETLPEPLQWLLINRTINRQGDHLLGEYANIMVTKSPNLTWFDTQESLIDKLVYYRQFELAQQWIDLLKEQDLRERYVERVQEQQEWLDFYQVYQQ